VYYNIQIGTYIGTIIVCKYYVVGIPKMTIDQGLRFKPCAFRVHGRTPVRYYYYYRYFYEWKRLTAPFDVGVVFVNLYYSSRSTVVGSSSSSSI